MAPAWLARMCPGCGVDLGARPSSDNEQIWNLIASTADDRGIPGPDSKLWLWPGQRVCGFRRSVSAAGNPKDRITARASLPPVAEAQCDGCIAHPRSRVTRRFAGCGRASCASRIILHGRSSFSKFEDRNVGKLLNSMARRDSKRIALERILEKESR